MTVTFVLPVVIVFLAGILTGVTGFGFSVLSVPLLLLGPLLPPAAVQQAWETGGRRA